MRLGALLRLRRQSRREAFAPGGTGTGGGLGSRGAVVVDDAGRHLYAVNAGSDSITWFRIRPHGLCVWTSSRPTATARRASPSTATCCTSSTPGATTAGDQLIVAERGAHLLGVSRVDAAGVAGSPGFVPSSGAVPFGFDVDYKGHVVVSEAAGAPAAAPCPRTRWATGPWT